MDTYRTYHDVSLTFNWWMMILVVNFAVSFILGYKQPTMKALAIKRRFSNKVLTRVITILTIINAIIFVMESWTGLVQIILNHSPQCVLPDFIALIAVIVASMLDRYLLLCVANDAVSHRVEELRRLRREITKK